MQDRSIQIRAMSSAQRLEILRLLKTPETYFATQWSADPVEFGVCMTLIAEALGVSQPTASRHIDLLRQAGFITVRRKGKWAYCRRQEAVLGDYLRWISETLSADGIPA
ncbi:helix-turn-helix transcriptional regulator [Stappia sp. MMSF_3263]|uniref:ArsR/SmtB family transcription factor n=1 Tax=Stappia sp. MMSF_3263 TaxID=3046693 RepID=UPI00273F90A8|nr:metalloregulator ArsR/SmtB family transcription factor [Stappia sp. MMSF_3263]